MQNCKIKVHQILEPNYQINNIFFELKIKFDFSKGMY